MYTRKNYELLKVVENRIENCWFSVSLGSDLEMHVLCGRFSLLQTVGCQCGQWQLKYKSLICGKLTDSLKIKFSRSYWLFLTALVIASSNLKYPYGGSNLTLCVGTILETFQTIAPLTDLLQSPTLRFIFAKLILSVGNC